MMKKTSPGPSLAGEILGAFADGGILFPLLVMLSYQGSFAAPVLFASAGLAYVISGLIFKIPMPVQPLKAIAVAAVAMHAGGMEIRLSGFVLGLFCLVLALVDVDVWVRKIPLTIVHCVQLGLGVILVAQGLAAVNRAGPLELTLIIAVALGICLFTSYPLLGVFAVCGLIVGFLFPSLLPAPPVSGSAADSPVRVWIILSLVLPQLALTSANSVVATLDVAKRYYGRQAERVTAHRLLLSIGWGNVLSALCGGLPYCHGSGGVTAHYRGGARTFRSNLVVGLFLLIVGASAFFCARPALIGYPSYVLAVLLVAVGFFHMTMARPSWSRPARKIQLFGAALIAWVTHNMLAVLVSAVAFEWVFNRLITAAPCPLTQLETDL